VITWEKFHKRATIHYSHTHTHTHTHRHKHILHTHAHLHTHAPQGQQGGYQGEVDYDYPE